MSFVPRFPFAAGGLLLVVLALAALTTAAPRETSAASILVTNTNDSGAGSLRQAITDANSNAGPDTISFNILACPPACTITLASGLPEVYDDETMIDGLTEPQYAGTPLVTIDGSAVVGAVDGLVVSGGDGSTIRALAIEGVRFGMVAAGDDITFDYNRISGSTLDGMGGAGVGITIRDNVIEDSGRYGILGASGDGMPGAQVTGNEVGNSGWSGIGIMGDGVTITGNTVVGSADDGITSGWSSTGVVIEDNESTDNGQRGINLWGDVVVKDNTASGNGWMGISVGGYAGGNTVVGNVATGNGQAGTVRDTRAGIAVYAPAVTFYGNESSGNVGDGVYLEDSAAIIGGLGPGQANTITGNGGAGIYVQNPEGSGSAQPSGLEFDPEDNTFSANSISGNGGLGIDLAPEGVTANDVLDADTGPNRHQNFPVLTSASTGNSVTVTGSLNSRPEGQFRIEFFANDACDDPSGQGEGEEYLGAADVVTDVQGNAAINVVLAVDVDSGRFITATATNLGTDDTSEFSNCAEVDAPASTPTPTPTPAPGTATPTPTATPEPSATATPGGEAKSGDVDCDEDADSVDALKVLRHVAGLPVDQEEPCPDIGSEVASLFGDVDCDEDVDSVDSLRILRYVAGLPNDLPDGCPPIGV